MKTILVLLWLLYAAAANGALAVGNSLVFHDDFEPVSPQSSPPGWAMWGAAQHKVPANSTRDTANGSWSRAVPCHIRLRNFRAKHTISILLTSHQLDTKPLLERKQDAVSEFAVQLAAEDATCVIPPHAVVFVTLTR